MTTSEKLLVQVFDTKNRIIEQVRQQTELYNRHLASKALLLGKTPPSWLFNSNNSTSQELSKDDLISELLPPRLPSRPPVRYSVAGSSQYSKPFLTDFIEVADVFGTEAHASNKDGPDVVEGPSTIVEGNECIAQNTSNCIPECDISSPVDFVDARTSNIYTASDQSLARIQRSKSRQKAIEQRNSAKSQAKSNLGNERTPRASSSGNILFALDNEQAGPNNDSNILSEPCAVSGAKQSACSVSNENEVGACSNEIKLTTLDPEEVQGVSEPQPLSISSEGCRVEGKSETDYENSGDGYNENAGPVAISERSFNSRSLEKKTQKNLEFKDKESSIFNKVSITSQDIVDIDGDIGCSKGDGHTNEKSLNSHAENSTISKSSGKSYEDTASRKELDRSVHKRSEDSPIISQTLKVASDFGSAGHSCGQFHLSAGEKPLDEYSLFQRAQGDHEMLPCSDMCDKAEQPETVNKIEAIGVGTEKLAENFHLSEEDESREKSLENSCCPFLDAVVGVPSDSLMTNKAGDSAVQMTKSEPRGSWHSELEALQNNGELSLPNEAVSTQSNPSYTIDDVKFSHEQGCEFSQELLVEEEKCYSSMNYENIVSHSHENLEASTHYRLTEEAIKGTPGGLFVSMSPSCLNSVCGTNQEDEQIIEIKSGAIEKLSCSERISSEGRLSSQVVGDQPQDSCQSLSNKDLEFMINDGSDRPESFIEEGHSERNFGVREDGIVSHSVQSPHVEELCTTDADQSHPELESFIIDSQSENDTSGFPGDMSNFDNLDNEQSGHIINDSNMLSEPCAISAAKQSGCYVSDENEIVACSPEIKLTTLDPEQVQGVNEPQPLSEGCRIEGIRETVYENSGDGYNENAGPVALSKRPGHSCSLEKTTLKNSEVEDKGSNMFNKGSITSRVIVEIDGDIGCSEGDGHSHEQSSNSHAKGGTSSKSSGRSCEDTASRKDETRIEEKESDAHVEKSSTAKIEAIEAIEAATDKLAETFHLSEEDECREISLENSCCPFLDDVIGVPSDSLMTNKAGDSAVQMTKSEPRRSWHSELEARQNSGELSPPNEAVSTHSNPSNTNDDVKFSHEQGCEFSQELLVDEEKCNSTMNYENIVNHSLKHSETSTHSRWTEDAINGTPGGLFVSMSPSYLNSVYATNHEDEQISEIKSDAIEKLTCSERISSEGRLSPQVVGDQPQHSGQSLGNKDLEFMISDGNRPESFIEEGHSERNFGVREDGIVSHSVLSPHIEELCTTEFESFIIDSQSKNDTPGFSGDMSNFDNLELPKSTIARVSMLERLCKSACSTPLSYLSSMDKVTDLFHSIPNGLLEHVDLEGIQFQDDVKECQVSLSMSSEAEGGLQEVSPTNTCSAAPIGLSAVNGLSPPEGRYWEGYSSRSRSSGKRLSSKPEFECFTIQEDPCISEGNESLDEDGDKLLKDIDSSTVNCHAIDSDKFQKDNESLIGHCAAREPSTGTHNKFKSFLKSSHKKKHTRKDTQTPLPSGKRIAKESYNTGYKKLKTSGILSLRNERLDSTRKPTTSNIVSNVTSFLPLIQQKQAAAKACQGKREIKVKALEAAETAKRLEEKRENERKLKKEALIKERAKRMEQEKAKQVELIKKKEEDEQRRKDADMVLKKRLREEEEKKEERKRARTEETRQKQRDQEEKVQAKKAGNNDNKKKFNHELKLPQIKKPGGDHVKLDNESRLAAISSSDIQQASICPKESSCAADLCDNKQANCTPGRVKTSFFVGDNIREESYDISPYQGSDDEDDELHTNKFIPSWASKNLVAESLILMRDVDPSVIFPPESLCSMDEVLLPRKLQQGQPML